MSRIVDTLLLNTYRNEPCRVCGSCHGTVAHHIKTKGSGGHDIEQNLVALCFAHHTEIHQIGMKSFSKKYLQFKLVIEKKGWRFDERFNKWLNPTILQGFD